MIYREPEILRGNYDISKIVTLIKTKFYKIFTKNNIYLIMDPFESGDEINPNSKFAMTCFDYHSVLKLLVLGTKSIVHKTL